MAGLARRHGLSHAGLNALAVIEGNAEPLPAGELASRMHITSGATTSLLDTLERKGYVRRTADAGDRRRVLLDITPAAQDLLDELLPAVQQLSKAVMAPLGDRALRALLDTLAQVSATARDVPDELPRATRRRPPHLTRRTT